MPALDQCEEVVIKALQKAGWTIFDKPFAINTGKRGEYIYADLKLKHHLTQKAMILVEVKCFSSGKSHWDELYTAIGQYLIYRNALQLKQLKEELYLAVPSTIYRTFFKQAIVNAALQDSQIHLVIVNLDTAEVEQWIP